MNLKRYNILVTGIGGNVGQGILRNLMSMELPMRLIGTNTRAMSAGNHLCDSTYEVPFAYDDTYIPRILAICKEEAIDLIIPSTDYETYYLALQRSKLPTVACLAAETAHIFLDKYRTWEEFKRLDIPFAEAVKPGEYDGSWADIIVKPREGRGSRGIHVNPKEPNLFPADYMIQKCYKGQEITTVFYVTKKRKLHGQVTFKRDLEAGTTTYCEVSHEYDEKIVPILEKMIERMDIQGSCNLQSIVNEEGVFPFEVNGRISGTNSIRSQFGFKDVQYTVEECLLDKEPEQITLRAGSAIRILMDVIFPGTALADVKNNSLPHYLF